VVETTTALLAGIIIGFGIFALLYYH